MLDDTSITPVDELPNLASRRTVRQSLIDRVTDSELLIEAAAGVSETSGALDAAASLLQAASRELPDTRDVL